MADECSRNFEYFYGIESDSYNFLMVPKLLLQDPYYQKLNDAAKILYAVLLERMSLSRKNNWVDDENRVYIMYSNKSICENMGWSNDKTCGRLKELERFGLIEREKKGQGKCSTIYVKDFLHVVNEPSNTDKIAEVGKSDFKNSENQISENPEGRIQEIGKADTNNTNIIYTELSETELSKTDTTTTKKEKEDVVVDEKTRLLFNPLKEKLSDKDVLTLSNLANGNEELIKGAIDLVVNYRKHIPNLVGLMRDYIEKGGYSTVSYQPTKKKNVNTTNCAPASDGAYCWSFVNWNLDQSEDKNEYALAVEKFLGVPFSDEMRDYLNVYNTAQAKFRELEEMGYKYDSGRWTTPEGKKVKANCINDLLIA